HRPAEETKLNDLPNRRRVENGQERRDQRVLRLMRAVRGLAAMIITSNREKAALGGRALEVAQLEGLASAIDTHTLTVPEPEHAFESRAPEPLQCLSATDGTDRQLLIQAWHEPDVVRVE